MEDEEVEEGGEEEWEGLETESRCGARREVLLREAGEVKESLLFILSSSLSFAVLSFALSSRRKPQVQQQIHDAAQTHNN